jgi:hypothetical protein
MTTMTMSSLVFLYVQKNMCWVAVSKTNLSTELSSQENKNTKKQNMKFEVILYLCKAALPCSNIRPFS